MMLILHQQKYKKHDMGNVRGKHGWFGRAHETLRRRFKRLLPFMCPLLFPHTATKDPYQCIICNRIDIGYGCLSPFCRNRNTDPPVG